MEKTPSERMFDALLWQKVSAMIDVSEDVYRALIDDRDGIEFVILPQRAFLILSAIQLACVHPEVGEELKSTWRDIGNRLQFRLVQLHPDLTELCEAGWERKHDVKMIDPKVSEKTLTVFEYTPAIDECPECGSDVYVEVSVDAKGQAYRYWSCEVCEWHENLEDWIRLAHEDMWDFLCAPALSSDRQWELKTRRVVKE